MRPITAMSIHMKKNAFIIILFFRLARGEYSTRPRRISFRYGIPTSSDSTKEILPSLKLEAIMTSTKSLISSTTTAARKVVHRIPSSLNNHNHNKLRMNLHEIFDTKISNPAVIRRREDTQNLYKTTDVSSVRTFRENVAEPLSRQLEQSGVYFGLSPKTIVDSYSSTSNSKGETRKKRVDLRDSMGEALDELRIMRSEMEAIRKEMHILQQQLIKRDAGSAMDDDDMESQQQVKAKRKKKLKEYEKISKDVEEWAKRLLSDQLQITDSKTSKNSNQANDNIEWNEIQCAKMLESKLNPNGKTHAFITYMKDSRDSKSKATTASLPKNNKNYNSAEDYPCIKMYSTLDAPIEEVCVYLSQEKHVWDYNSLIQSHGDIEAISSNSKVCWAQTPQILFVKPKDFVTYCSHRWLPDDTQIVINQATDHDSRVANAYAFRGATIIRRNPDNPTQQTQIYMLAHASPGSDIPSWAMKTAVKSLVPIEPFRLFNRMNQGIQQSKNELQQELKRLREKNDAANNNINNEAIEMVTNTSTESIMSTSRNERTLVKNWLPGGIAQLGFACFWPDGGGPVERAQKSNMSMPSANDPTNEIPTSPSKIADNDERISTPDILSKTTMSSFTDGSSNPKITENTERQLNGQSQSTWQPHVLQNDDTEHFEKPTRLLM